MSYIYSLSGDFTDGIAITQFKSEIKANITITTVISRVNVDGDVVLVGFVSSLSGPEKSALDAVVASHIPSDETSGEEISNGAGVLYGDDSGNLFWNPTGGSAINLLTANLPTQTVEETSSITLTNTSYQNLDGMSITATADGDYLFLFNTSIETSTNSVVALCRFYINGSSRPPRARCGQDSGRFPVFLAHVDTLSNGDTVTLRTDKNNNGGSYTVYYRRMSIVKLS